ncbi:DUF1714 domain-containing protein [Histoplasma ohiense]|nr:DUF1714 domain-containing protein [Histoplasma ohiense (nom. inval.)]
MASPSLRVTLAQAIPKDVELIIRHLATDPTPCPALFSPLPGQSEEPTTCETHFITVSIQPEVPGDDTRDNNRVELFIFAIEILVFITANLTTVFVSKADSTGYLYRLKLPPTAKSLMRSISTSFLSHIVSSHQRPGIRLVLSLFARAQNQYLFPGSVENPRKHILDDRGLVKWWCRVVDPILRRHEPEAKADANGHPAEEQNRDTEAQTTSATAYLIVPGCDKFESKTFFPPSAKSDPQTRPRWLNSYPLYQICGSRNAPPRCQVPRFPDDPKARFLLDLDYEVPDVTNESSTGQWRSIKTIDQFWEMMAYRQECSAGRLVGFLWVVINPPGLLNSVPMISSTSQNAHNQTKRDIESTPSKDTTLESSASESKVSGQVRNSTAEEYHNEFLPQNDVMTKDPPTCPTSASFESDTGIIKLDDKSYHDLVGLLIELDFDNEKTAIESTGSWISKLSTLIGRNNHGEEVIGESLPVENFTHQPTDASKLLRGGLIRKRKKDAGDTGTPSVHGKEPDSSSVVANLEGDDDQQSQSPNSGPQIMTPTINVLNASVIRKKKKKEES